MHFSRHPAVLSDLPALRLSLWVRRLALAGVVLCFGVVVLGGYVRLTAAGLGCPDWPGCYGHVTPLGAEESASAQAAFPARPLDVGKAWREMIHRYAASTLGLIIVVIAATAIVTRRTGLIRVPYAIGLLLLVVFQGVLGMLTVTWRLKPLIVTGHLLFGLTTLSLLWWLWLSLPAESPGPANGLAVQGPNSAVMRTNWRLALIGLVGLGCQIALGGWTSSNYAAVACPDFPTCQNAWWPHADFRDAFVLWRGLAINFEGGVLDQPARVAIHLTHRLGALMTTVLLSCAVAATLLRAAPRGAQRAAMAVLAALALQLAIGICMVLRGFPLWLATAHTGGAALLLLSVLALLRNLMPAPPP